MEPVATDARASSTRKSGLPSARDHQRPAVLRVQLIERQFAQQVFG